MCSLLLRLHCFWALSVAQLGNICIYTNSYIYMHLYLLLCLFICVYLCVWVCVYTHEFTPTPPTPTPHYSVHFSTLAFSLYLFVSPLSEGRNLVVIIYNRFFISSALVYVHTSFRMLTCTLVRNKFTIQNTVIVNSPLWFSLQYPHKTLFPKLCASLASPPSVWLCHS